MTTAASPAGELLNIDGKTLRGAKEAGNSRSLIHMVSVWSASQHLVLGQTKVSEKLNEITAIPQLVGVKKYWDG